MTRLIVIAQRVDENDDHRAFFVGWLKEFGKNFDEVAVIALAGGVHALPSNVQVHSLGKERGISKFRQALRFYRHLLRLLPGSSGIFAHASPIFIIASWPLAVLYRTKLVLWYLHKSVTLKLRLAVWMSTWVVTADAAGLHIKSAKVLEVGHGIDMDRFAVSDRTPPGERPMRVLSVGRFSPIKDYATLIRAAALARDQQVALEVRIIGRAVMPADHAYARELSELVSRLGASDIIHFFGFVPYCDMPVHYRWADVVVGCTPSGGLDKVLLEGMAAGCVVLTSNDVMDASLGEHPERFLFPHGDSEALAQRLGALEGWDDLREQMVAEVSARHDVHQTVARISEIMVRNRAS